MDERTLRAYCAMVDVVAYSVYSAMLYAAHQRENSDLPYSEENARLKYSLDQLTFYDMSSSDYQWLPRVLYPLGMMVCPSGPNGEFQSSMHQFIRHPSEAGRFARLHWRKGVSFAELLRNFLWYYSEYGTEYFGLEFRMNVIFYPKNGMENAIHALSQLRYAEKYKGGYRWGKKMKAFIRRCVKANADLIARKAYDRARLSMGDYGFPRLPYRPPGDDE